MSPAAQLWVFEMEHYEDNPLLTGGEDVCFLLVVDSQVDPNNFLAAPLQYDLQVDRDFQDQYRCVEGDFQEIPVEKST